MQFEAHWKDGPLIVGAVNYETAKTSKQIEPVKKLKAVKAPADD